MSRTVRIAAYIWAGSILLSRLVGLVRESVIGRTLGASTDADLFWLSFVLPDFLNYLLASGVLSIVFIPLFQAHLARGEVEAGWTAFSTLANFVTALLLLFTAMMWWLAPSLVPYLAEGITDPALLDRLARLTRIVIPAQIFHVIGGLISATLQARDKHALPAMAPIVYSLCIVIGGVLFGAEYGAEGFAWGALVGSVLGPFGLPLVGALRHGLRWRLTFDHRHPDFRYYLARSVPVMLGASVVALDEHLVKYFGNPIGEGVVARLQYARNLMKVPMGVFGFAAGLAAFPTLSRLVTEGKNSDAYRLLVKSLRMTLVLAVTAQVGLTVAGLEIATVIWGTRSFTAADLTEIGTLTSVLCLGLWAWSAQSLLARGFYAQGRTWPPTLIGSLVMLGSLPGYAFSTQYGPVGLALASSMSVSIYVVILSIAVRRSLDPAAAHDGPGLWDAVLRLAFAAGLGIAVGYGLDVVIPAWPALIRGTLTGGTAAVVCLVAAAMLGVSEVRMVVNKVRRKLSRS